MADVLVTRKTYPEVLAELERAGLAYDHNAPDVALTPTELQDRVAGARALICLLTDKIDAAVMDAAPNLKVIANVAVGYDNIDVAAATEREIVVTNTPDVLTETTADLAWALLLATARRLNEAETYMRAGKYQRWELFQPHLGVDVYGKTLGIVGMGRIGQATARRGALGFGMQVIYTSRTPKPEVDRELGARRVSFEELLQQSDFVSIHTPLTVETRHLFTLREFEQMKADAILVNTARGPVVKEADLVVALERGLIRGAGLDVFEDEPLMHPGLLDLHQHVIVVPHIGSASVETRRRMSLMAAENVVAGLAVGRCPPNAVNPAVWGGLARS